VTKSSSTTRSATRSRPSLGPAGGSNAQTLELLDELDAAWRRAADDPEVRVIILQAKRQALLRPVTTSKGVGGGSDVAPPKWTLGGDLRDRVSSVPGVQLRWRNVPKPSIAAVQGVCISGRLLLAWPCDLIIAADNATFSDPVVTWASVRRVHGHTWEMGAARPRSCCSPGARWTPTRRSASAWSTGSCRCGPARATRRSAAEIATKHPFALPPGKRAVNQTLGTCRASTRRPVGLRHPPDRPRPRAVRERHADPHAARRHEGAAREAVLQRSLTGPPGRDSGDPA